MWYASLFEDQNLIPHDLLQKIEHIVLDTRAIKKNTLFAAIRGAKVDGHQFLEEAKELGAIGAIVEMSYEGPEPFPLIRVENVKDYLQRLAKTLIQLWKPFVIGITGSIGKTSTKDYLYTLLSKTLSVHKTPGNFNSQLTLPLTILNAERVDYLILEMGMDRPGELDRLIDIAPPDLAILTTLAHVHVESFHDFESLAHEKFKIFSHPQTKAQFYYLECPFAEKLHGKTSVSLKDPKADYYLKQNEGNTLELFENGQPLFTFENPLFDHKSQVNLLHALAVAKHLNVPCDVLKEQLKQIKFPEKRMQLKEYKGVLFLDDSYNSCVESVENALMTLPQREGRRIAILSDMIDQGQYSVENHEKIARLALEHADILIGIGEEFHVMVPIWKKSGKKWAFFLTYEVLSAYFNRLVKRGDTVLIKGKRLRALERVIDDFIAH